MFENWKSTTYTKPDPITDSINKIKPEISIFRGNLVISACFLVCELFYCVSRDSNPSALRRKCNVVPGERPNKFVLVVVKVFWSQCCTMKINPYYLMICLWNHKRRIMKKGMKIVDVSLPLVFISANSNCSEFYVCSKYIWVFSAVFS